MRTIGADTAAFTTAVGLVRSVTVRPELQIDEVPAPQRLAPHAIALTAELTGTEDDDGPSARFVLLHDPDGVDEWGGDFRAVVFVRAPIEADLLEDPVLFDVGWAWVADSLADVGADAIHLGGTITRTAGQSYGTMADRPAEAFLEVRGSWTPVDSGGAVEEVMDRHAQAWLLLVERCAGLPPLVGEEGVEPLRRRALGNTALGDAR